jgi:hypothetical protein
MLGVQVGVAILSGVDDGVEGGGRFRWRIVDLEKNHCSTMKDVVKPHLGSISVIHEQGYYCRLANIFVLDLI